MATPALPNVRQMFSNRKSSSSSTPSVTKFGSTGLNVASLPAFTGSQEELSQMVNAALKPYLSGSVGTLGKVAAGDPAQFEALEAPALRQFSDMLGGIGARFSHLNPLGQQGALSAQNSSGFQHAQNSAAQQLTESLQSQRLGLQFGAIKELQDLYKFLMGEKHFNQFLQPEEEPLWKQILGGSLPVIGAGVGGYYGGATGAALGGKAGSALGGSFLGSQQQWQRI